MLAQFPVLIPDVLGLKQGRVQVNCQKPRSRIKCKTSSQPPGGQNSCKESCQAWLESMLTNISRRRQPPTLRGAYTEPTRSLTIAHPHIYIYIHIFCIYIYMYIFICVDIGGYIYIYMFVRVYINIIVHSHATSVRVYLSPPCSIMIAQAGCSRSTLNRVSVSV